MNDPPAMIPDAPLPPDSADAAHGHAPTIAAARLLVIAAAVLWSTSGFFVKAPYFQDGAEGPWPGPVLAFWRAAFACIVLLPLVRRPPWSWKLIPTAATFALLNYTYLTAPTGEAASAMWRNAPRSLGADRGRVCVRVKAGWRRLLLAFGRSAWESFWSVNSAGRPSNRCCGAASGVFYAGWCCRCGMRAMSRLAGFRQSCHDGGWCWPFCFRNALPSGIQWLLLAGLGMVQMGLPYVFFARGLRTIPGHEAAGIGLTEPILVPIWVYLAWGDQPAVWTLVGGGFILAGLAVRYLEPLRRPLGLKA
jgi:hypothetical protein